MRLYGADIGGNLECNGGSFKNPGGTALNAESARIGAHALVSDGFKAEGAISVASAVIGGDFYVGCLGDDSRDGADFSAVNFDAQRAEINGALSVVGTRTGPETTMNLGAASCTVLVDAPDRREIPKCWPAQGNLALDGFTYRRIEMPGQSRERLAWLRRQLPADKEERRGRFRPTALSSPRQRAPGARARCRGQRHPDWDGGGPPKVGRS